MNPNPKINIMTIDNNDANNFSALVSTLCEIGLTGAEAKVYLTLLNLGTNPASTLASHCGLNRSSCYQVLTKLMKRGFTAQINKGTTAFFTATRPKYILEQLKFKQNKLSSNIIKFNETLTRFERMKSEAGIEKPKVTFFHGEEGVINIMEDTLTSKTNIRAYASMEELVDMLPDYFRNYYEKRTAKNIFVKSMYPASIRSYLHKTHDKQELRESRLIPDEYNICLDLMIYDNKVAITSIRERFGLLIESKDIASAQKKIFDVLWEKVKEYDKTITKELAELIKTISEPDRFKKY